VHGTRVTSRSAKKHKLSDENVVRQQQSKEASGSCWSMDAMRIDILSLFPSYFQGPFDESIIGQARKKGLLEIRLHDIRDQASGKHRKVDDRPYGGGPGMVMMAEPTVAAIHSVKTPEAHVVYLSPQGKPLTAQRGRELVLRQPLILG